MGRRIEVAAALAAVAVVSGTLTGCEADPVRSTLARLVDPVVVTGEQADALAGTAPDRVVAFRASSQGWTQLPVQVDERLDTTMAAVYGLPASQTFYGSSINIPVNVYADPNTFVGADTDPALDADDEIAFMARDAGGPAGDLAAPRGTTGSGVEVKVSEPDDAESVGYVYLFAADGSLDPSAGKQYVDYEFRLNSGDYKTTYERTDGPNPENSTVTAGTYTAHFSDRWTMDGLSLTFGDRPGVDLIDRSKYDIPLFCARNENTFNDEEGAFIVNRSGPVRALRGYVGTNSGPNTQNTQVFYDTTIETTNNLRVHAIPTVRGHMDFSREAIGMTLRDPANPDGVRIDGQPETARSSEPSWWTVTGPQGGLGFSVTYDNTASGAATRWYLDDETSPSDTQCTGDNQAIGDTGSTQGSLTCTDPGLGCTDRFNTRNRIVAAPAGIAPAGVQQLAEQGLHPLTISTTRFSPG
jgi:hypothetical protein